VPQFAVAYLATSAAIGAGVLATGIAATTLASALVYGSLLVASVGYSNYARRKAERAALSTLQDRTMPIRASDAPRTIVYGQTRTSGVIVYGASHDGGTDLGVDDEVTLIYALTGHPVDSIVDVWLNEKSAGTLTSTGEVTSGDWYKGERVALAESFVPVANNQTLTLSESAPLESIDSVAFVFDTGAPEFQREQFVLRAGVDYTANVSAKTVTLINNGTFNAVGVDLVVTYVASRGSSKLRIKAFLGNEADLRDTDLEDWTEDQDAPWTENHLGKGVARLHVTHRWDDTVYTSGIPSASAIVRGRRVYDPRADSTNGGSGSQRVATPSTWVWSRNPALCAADYLMYELGFGVPASKIDWPSVIAAANACDETVNGGARYLCDGVLSTDAARKANLEAILSAMVGSAFYSGGRWYIRAGVANPATPFELDESDLAGGEVTVLARQPRADLFNAVRGRFVDPANLYAVSDFVPYESSVYAAQDNGEVIYQDVELPMTQDGVAAQRIAKLILNRSRQAVTIAADWKLAAYRLQPGDTVNLTLARYGWSAKLFRVIEREFADLSRVRLVLQEEAPAVYAWDFDIDATILDPAPNTNLPDPRYVAPPTGVTLLNSELNFYSRADGTAVPYLDVTWDAPTSPDVYTELFWKRAEETTFRLIATAALATSARIEPVSGGDVLNLYLQHVSSTGARSVIYWVPSFTLDPDLPVNGQPVGTLSANLVPNASFEYGVERWTPAATVSGVTFTKDDSIYAIGGPISNGRLQIVSAVTGAGNFAWTDSAPIAIIAGGRYVAFSGVVPWGVDGNVEILWFSAPEATGASYISSAYGNTVTGDSATSPSRNPGQLSAYATTQVFAVAPAGAQYARMRVAAGGTWTASDVFGAKYLWLAQPYFGRVPLGVSDLPPWDAGGSPVSGTGGLAIGAATEILSGVTAGGAFPNPGPASLDVQILEMPISGAGVLEVSATFEVQGSGTGGGGGGENRISAGLFETSKGVALVSREALTAPATETRRATVTLIATIPVVAGDTVRPVLRISRTRFGIVGGVTVGNSTDAVGAISWRATLIKR